MLRKLVVTGALVTILGIAAFFAPHEGNVSTVPALTVFVG